MIDLLTLVLTHGLIVLALWRLLSRDELDTEELATMQKPWLRQNPSAPGGGPANA